jgi:hypothetical protein
MPIQPTDRERPDARVALLWIVAAMLIASAAGSAVYKAWPVLYPQTAERAPLPADCDLRAGPCEAVFAAGGRVWLDIRPRGIPVVHPLEIRVRLQGLPAPERVELDFAGVDMDMGYNRVALARDAAGEYAGTGMLPVCVRDRMTWEARVLLYRPDGVLAAPFRFDTARR